jgi:hypothetical protein
MWHEKVVGSPTRWATGNPGHAGAGGRCPLHHVPSGHRARLYDPGTSGASVHAKPAIPTCGDNGCERRLELDSDFLAGLRAHATGVKLAWHERCTPRNVAVATTRTVTPSWA